MTRTFDQILARLVRNYRQPINDETAADYERELAHVSLPLLDDAVTHVIRTCKFMPNVAELLEAVQEMRQADPANSPQPYEPCSRCIDGWIDAGPSRELQQLVGFERDPNGAYVHDANGRRMRPFRRDANGKLIPIVATLRADETRTRCSCWFEWRRRQGLPVPQPRPTQRVDLPRTYAEVDGKAVKTTMTAASELVTAHRRKPRVIAGGKR